MPHPAKPRTSLPGRLTALLRLGFPGAGAPTAFAGRRGAGGAFLIGCAAAAVLGQGGAGSPQPGNPDYPVRAAVPDPPLTADSTASRDSLSQNATALDSAETLVDTAATLVYEYVANPTLQLLTWPVEKLLVPAVDAALTPTKAPLRYLLNENVIDRTIDLISFGDEDVVMTYPTLGLAPGTGTRTGVTLRHNALFGRPQEKLVAYLLVYVNGDMRFRTYATASELFGTDWGLKGSASIKRQKNAYVNQPGTSKTWYYSDSSEYYMAQISHPLGLGFVGRGAGYLKRYRLGKAPPQEDELESDFFRNGDGEIDPGMRGLEQSFWDRIAQFTLERDTRNNPHITLAGSNLEANGRYHFTDQGHDFIEGNFTYTKYFKLGSERYEITRAEEKKDGGMTLKRVLRQMEIEKLRTTIFNRKVVAVRWVAARSWELPGHSMPVYGLQTLGNDTPLRGYSGPRFRDMAVAGMSMEYRFPIMRLVDGVIFDEYGVIGPDFSTAFDFDRIKNSWGFGLRVRRPDIFLFRAELGFHGAKGAVLTLSTGAAY